MSFNWRLLLAPPEILDYVVEHEVAHLEIHDHSQRFWDLLDARCPGYRSEERWLRRNGPTLRLGRLRLRHRSQRKPRIASTIPAAPQSASTASAPSSCERPLPVTIASEKPSITCFSGSASATAARPAGSESLE